MELKEVLRELTSLPGVSGHEFQVGGAVARHFGRFCQEVRTDRLGNVIGLLRGSGGGPAVMLAAHLDEIGLMVSDIDERGFLRFERVGGVDPRVLVSQEVTVHGARPLTGVIGAKPPHIQSPEEKQKSYPPEDLYIDIGLDKDEAAAVVHVGDVVTIRRDMVSLAGDAVAGKALDDRAGIVVLLACLEELAGSPLAVDVYAVATVQEEPGTRGAVTASYGIRPDVGIVVDVTFADTMEGKFERIDLGKGPGVGVGPHVHPKLYERCLAVAKDAGISIQVDPATSPAGTDAYVIQVARQGVPTLLIEVPLRNMHTSVELVKLSDVSACGSLLAKLISGFDAAFVEELRCF